MEGSRFSSTSDARDKKKQRVPEEPKMSGEEKAIRALSVLSACGSQALKIDPVTPAKVAKRKRSAVVGIASQDAPVGQSKGQLPQDVAELKETCSSHTNIFVDRQTKRKSRSKQACQMNRKDVKKRRTLTDAGSRPSTSGTQILLTPPIFPNIVDTAQYHGDQNQEHQHSPDGVNQTHSTTKKRKHSIYKRKTSDLLLPGGLDAMQNSPLSVFSNRANATSNTISLTRIRLEADGDWLFKVG